MKLHTIVVFILLFFQSLPAQQFITGELSGLLKPGDYIISGTVYVLKNQKLQIAPGTRLFFDQFSSLTVLGEIRCDGSESNPVTFSSVKEYQGYNQTDFPDVFDWNGIEIGSEATFVSFDHAEIRYCIFGLKIKSTTTRIRLNHVKFANIGYASISRGGNLVPLKIELPFSCLWNINPNDNNVQTYVKKTPLPETMKDTTSPAKVSTVKNHKGNYRNAKTKLRVLSGAALCALCSSISLFASSIGSNHNKNKYEIQTIPTYAQHYRESFYTCRKWQYVSGSMLTISALCMIITIPFPF